MKSFLWRLRSNAVWFLIAMAVFVGLYIYFAYSQIYTFDIYVLRVDHVNPFIECFFVTLGFFLIYTKRYSYDEEYIYGHSRRHAFFSSLGVAAIYSLLFACLVLGSALLVRRSIVSAHDAMVIAELYRLSAVDIILNFISFFLLSMVAYESAILFRKFKSWRFWLTFIGGVGIFFGLYRAVYYIAQFKWFNYWVGMFFIFVPLFVVLTVCDFLRTRGRQYR